MADVGGFTEIQVLDKQIQLLRRKADAVKTAEKTSVGCARIASSIQASQGKDGFVVSEGGSPNSNIFHTAAGTTGESGCCVVS